MSRNSSKRRFNNEKLEKPKKKVIQFSMQKSSELQERIHECIKDNNINIGTANICGLMVTPYISKQVAGRCIRSGKQLKHFSNFDYIIEISKEFWDGVSDRTKQILILHEVLHINVKYKKDGTEVFAITPHDIEDFSRLIKKYGVDWVNDIQLVKQHMADRDDQIYE